MKKLLTILTFFAFSLSVKAQSGKATKYDTARYIERYIRGVGGDHFVNLRTNVALNKILDSIRCTHIWVDVVSDTVTNHAPPLLSHPVGLPPPKEWQSGNEIVCLLCKNKKKKVIHNVGYNNFYDVWGQFKNGVMLLDTLETYSHVDSAVRKKIKDAAPLIKYR